MEEYRVTDTNKVQVDDFIKKDQVYQIPGQTYYRRGILYSEFMLNSSHKFWRLQKKTKKLKKLSIPFWKSVRDAKF